MGDYVRVRSELPVAWDRRLIGSIGNPEHIGQRHGVPTALGAVRVRNAGVDRVIGQALRFTAQDGSEGGLGLVQGKTVGRRKHVPPGGAGADAPPDPRPMDQPLSAQLHWRSGHASLPRPTGESAARWGHLESLVGGGFSTSTHHVPLRHAVWHGPWPRTTISGDRPHSVLPFSIAQVDRGAVASGGASGVVLGRFPPRPLRSVPGRTTERGVRQGCTVKIDPRAPPLPSLGGSVRGDYPQGRPTRRLRPTCG